MIPEVHLMRFDRATRWLHVVIMVTFLGLAATGMPLLFSEAPAPFSISSTRLAPSKLTVTRRLPPAECRRALVSDSCTMR